jgi:putative peptidoglycan lipid II flippase
VVGASYFNRIVDRSLASLLGTGAVSFLYYGERLMFVPIEIFIWALGTSVLPFLSMEAADGNRGKMVEKTVKALRWSWMAVIPASFVMIFLSKPIVAIVFNSGIFNESAIEGTSLVLSLYSIGIFAIASNAILFKAFYALRAEGILLRVAILSMSSNILLDIILMGPLGVSGIALSTSLVEITTFVYLLYLFDRITEFGVFRWFLLELKIFLPASALLIFLLWRGRGILLHASSILLILIVASLIGYCAFYLTVRLSQRMILGKSGGELDV